MRIALVIVGPREAYDRGVPAMIERRGAMVINPEFAAIVAEIVRAARSDR
jgi:hypothetical protein